MFAHPPLVKTEVEGARTKLRWQGRTMGHVQLNLKPNYGWHNLHVNEDKTYTYRRAKHWTTSRA